MTGKELKERCAGRNFDQIIIVVKDIFQKVANMQRINKEVPGSICLCTQEDEILTGKDGQKLSYTEKRAFYFYSNTQLCFVEPVDGDTLYSRFLEKYGEGICCIRERIRPEEISAMEKHFADKGIIPVQRMEKGAGRAFWVDLTKELGILYECISDDTEKEPAVYCSEARISQVNITTPDVRETIKTIADILEIGPWEVGRQCNAVVHNSAFRENGELKEVDFSFLLAILVCGNIEWEVIEPEEGPLVYYDFLKRRGIGFHHVLQEIPAGSWNDRLTAFENDGVQMACKGSLGPVNWCYMDTEQDLGFYTELRTDAVMDKLPDGYLQFFYPED